MAAFMTISRDIGPIFQYYLNQTTLPFIVNVNLTMYVKSLVLCVAILQFLEQSCSHVLNRNVTETDCENICTSSEAQFEYDVETKLCTCLLPKTVDGTDLELVHKNANSIGKTLKTIEILNHDGIIIKREVPSVSTTETTELSTTTTSPETTTEVIETDQKTSSKSDDFEPNFSFEETVGQQQPQRRVIHRLVTPRRPRDPRPISPDQQRILLQQIRDHLNRLSQVFDSRVREMEIEAIRNNLRQLSHTVLIQTPQQRSRMRNVVEEARQRRRMQHRLGASENATVKHENEVDIALKDLLHGKKRHEIITQDPSLVDE
ncbi:uncharacterized protein LOC123007621 [Tribolium madens]|uniref:uncharacterized protein LOC123007621 n=1 Tax=Tribolium madens TaxID=41895 RepID=UPI001CF75528|nr:uncharacterized protein LOC123007621 [Tribolium madens]